MLVRADPQTDSISLLSFPRDLVGRDPLPGRHAVHGKINAGVRRLRRAGRAPDGEGAHRPPDQLPDHGQLPRLPADRRPASAASGSTSTAATSTTAAARFGYATIDLQPGYQQLTGRQALVVRPLPPHGLRPLPRRAPAAVRARVQEPDAGASFGLTTLLKLVNTITKQRGGRAGRRQPTSTATPSSPMRGSRTSSRAGASSRRASRASRASPS